MSPAKPPLPDYSALLANAGGQMVLLMDRLDTDTVCLQLVIDGVERCFIAQLVEQTEFADFCVEAGPGGAQRLRGRLDT